MKYSELKNLRKNYFSKIEYQRIYYQDYDYKVLKKIMYIKKPCQTPVLVNDCIIMLDTETSKSISGEVCENYLVAWTISIRTFHKNIVTLYGNKPSECIECISRIMSVLPGEVTYMYIYNLSYDWVFLRKFLINEYGIPVKQLNTKSHYPIYIEFENGLIFRDALCLAQRKLEKWASDLGVEHQKAVGYWDYDMVRGQDHRFTEDELTYIENDTLGGVECLDVLMETLHKHIYNMPWTATGIPREEVQKRGKEHNAHDAFVRQSLDFQQQEIMQNVYHGGYTHGNRYYYNETITGQIDCYDFASSYPFVLLSEKFPCEKFTPLDNCSMYDILNDKDNAYYFLLIGIDLELMDHLQPMPALQYSKCIKTVNATVDNGRILSADYVEIWLTETDLEVIAAQYHFRNHICVNVHASYKDYLPRWFTDYVFELFEAKTKLKGVDPVQYAISKAKLNSLYGMTVQRPVPVTLNENYETGEYTEADINKEEEYAKFLKRRKNVLNYQIGVWVTAYAFRNLFRLGSCCEEWIYSDTDSCYGLNWDKEKLDSYNRSCKEKLEANGYGCVLHNGREYWLGIAEHDGSYTEFRVVGAKRYCGRSADDGQIHITVAGVPKCGYKALNDNIDHFTDGMIFPGTMTGKKTHTYFYKEDIEIRNGIEYGDSIDLSPCDYLLSSVFTWSEVHKEEIEVSYYE